MKEGSATHSSSAAQEIYMLFDRLLVSELSRRMYKRCMNPEKMRYIYFKMLIMTMMIRYDKHF